MVQPAQVTLTLLPDLGEIRRVGAALDGFVKDSHLDEQSRFALELALDELLTNTITYGFGDRSGPVAGITLSLRCDRDIVRVIIEDDAAPYDPFDAPPPDLESDLEHRRVGGLGLYFVRRFTDAFRYRHEGGHNIVELELSTSRIMQKESE